MYDLMISSMLGEEVVLSTILNAMKLGAQPHGSILKEEETKRY
jgi:hypothetical protein